MLEERADSPGQRRTGRTSDCVRVESDQDSVREGEVRASQSKIRQDSLKLEKQSKSLTEDVRKLKAEMQKIALEKNQIDYKYQRQSLNIQNLTHERNDLVTQVLQF